MDQLTRVPNLKQYVPTTAAESELFDLRGKLVLLTDEKVEIFSGALDIESVEGMADVLRILNRLDSYRLYKDISTPVELGRMLVDAGEVIIHHSALPYVDYSRVATEYMAEHSGVYTKSGYVAKIGDGDPEPRQYVVKLDLCSQYLDANGAVYTLTFPASSNELAEAMEVLDINSFEECVVRSGITPVDAISRIGISESEIEAANLLSTRLERILKDPDDYKTFQAAVEVEQPRNIAGLAMIADDLRFYTLFPAAVDNAEEYGRYVLCDFNEFRHLDEFQNEVRDFIDYGAYGRYKMEEDGVRQTSLGMLRNERNPFPKAEEAWEHGMSIGGQK